MTELVQKCLGWQLRKGVNCDLALPRKALHISVRVIEWNALDIQRRKRPRRVPLGDRNWFKFLPASLRQNEPTRLVNKAGKSVFFVGIFLAALARDRHAQTQRSFAPLHKAAQVLPLRKGIDWTGL